MRVTVIRAFVDKESGQGYNVGDAYESENLVRVRALANLGFTEKPAIPASEKKSARKAAAK